MADYRPLSPDETATFHEFVSYAFDPGSGPEGMEYDPDEVTERNRMGEKRGLFDGDEPLAVCRHHWFETTLRGETVEMPGLSAVASPPEHRRGGNVREMLAASLREYRDRDAPICALWAFEYGFYRQFGWETANKWTELSCPPDALSFASESVDEAAERSDRDGDEHRWRRLDADDWVAVDDVYRAHTEGVDLALDRDEDWWRYRRFTGWDDDPFVYGWGTDETLRAYLFYEFDDGDEGRELRIREYGARDHEAFLRCLAFCRDHDSQVATVTFRDGPDPLLLDRTDSPEEVDATLRTGPMVRVVDVVDALETVTYPADGSVVLTIDDPLAEWNDDRVRLDVTDGDGTVHRTDADPDVELDVGALSQLLVGYAPAERLARTTDLRADDGTLRTLTALFPSTEVGVYDGF